MRTQSAKGHSIDATVLLNIDKALSKYGLDPSYELGVLGLQPSSFSKGELKIPLRLIADVLQHCIRATNCEHFILEMVQMQTSAVNSYFGMLLRTSPNLGDAFRLATQEVYILSKGATWSLQQEGNKASFSLLFDAQNLEPHHRPLLAELCIAQAWLVMRTQCQQPVQLDTVQFVRNVLPDKRPYKRFFKAPVQFNCDFDQLVVSTTQLEIPMSHADPHLHSAIRELIYLSKANLSGRTLVEEICSLIRMLLPQGNCTIDIVASYMMKDKRTLQRQLRKEFDVSFHSLRQAERLQMAQTYLQESQKSIIQIAYATGYKEPGNMARAFRKKFHCTPQQWRERHKLGNANNAIQIS